MRRQQSDGREGAVREGAMATVEGAGPDSARSPMRRAATPPNGTGRPDTQGQAISAVYLPLRICPLRCPPAWLVGPTVWLRFVPFSQTVVDELVIVLAGMEVWGDLHGSNLRRGKVCRAFRISDLKVARCGGGCDGILRI